MGAEGNVVLAFCLVIGAGLCTTLGAGFAFCAKITDHRLLALALGVSAGVMSYVSFVEIFTSKAISGFEDAGFETPTARRYATFCFFGGLAFTWALDRVVHLIMHLTAHRSRRALRANAVLPPGGSQPGLEAVVTEGSAGSQSGGLCSACSTKTGSEGGDSQGASSVDSRSGEGAEAAGAQCGSGCCKACGRVLHALECDVDCNECHERVHVPKSEPEAIKQLLAVDCHTGLARMGMLSALAVFIHNIPEGLATFVAALADTKAGIGIALAIALHNIPEGVVVAMPIYYATGSKWKGFLWATLSGVSEPLGGLLGYAVLAGRDMDPLAYAVLFALVAGIMVYISIRELLPTALKYDPSDRFVTRGFLCGMAVMAASLLLFDA